MVSQTSSNIGTRPEPLFAGSISNPRGWRPSEKNGARKKYVFLAKLLIFALLFVVLYRWIGTKTTNSFHIHYANRKNGFRILHIVTSLSEYNTGTRGTVKGEDRLKKVLIPVLCATVQSILDEEPSWQVDVFLILGFEKLLPERRQLIIDALPPGTGIEVWDNAIPFAYDKKSRIGDGKSALQRATHSLARQHRFVIRDKLEQYDFFSAWEDDMRITATHIRNFLEMTEELSELSAKAEAATEDPNPDAPNTFHGPMSASQLKRLIPGFIRVEVMEEGSPQPTVVEGIPIDAGVQLDPRPCCGATRDNPNPNLKPRDLLIWETNVKAFGVRKLPGSFGWAGMFPGVDTSPEDTIGSYWSGTDNVFRDEKVRLGALRADLFAQQAGFMATRDQVRNFQQVCPGGFLPPFDDSFWHENSGLKPQNVEFWSGGYQLFGRCFLQRFIALDPERFSKQLLFHTANNKQRTIRAGRLVRANDFFAQLLSVKGRAADKLAAKG